MKIVICASLDFTEEIKKTADKLAELGHQVVIPRTSEMILSGEVTLAQIKEEKNNGQIYKRAIRQDAIRSYFQEIEKSEAILVLNLDKKGVKNYVGGNTFLEIGLAYYLRKNIFFYNPVPKMSYSAEIKVMQPVVINGDLGIL
ncbi:hypothetical protein KJ903_02225 [Patescibacteria group bacterium]|nr:hypothetical protein [Patescibacteria group bacterium]